MEDGIHCPKCGALMIKKGDKIICSRESCGYEPTIEELLKQNNQLLKRISELEYRLQQVHRIRLRRIDI